jgi:PhoPQ-activated pathogenicity-related protein
MFFRARLLVAALIACTEVSLWAAPGWADLEQFIRKPEPAFAWKQNGKSSHGAAGDRVYDLHFVSQTWQGNNWQHQLQIYQPQTVAPSEMMLLWVTGGSATPGQIAFGMELARKSKAPVAFLYHIPNQPLLEDQLVEDDLIAETFVRYLKTKDENWPLLFPMVKSVV